MKPFPQEKDGKGDSTMDTSTTATATDTDDIVELDEEDSEAAKKRREEEEKELVRIGCLQEKKIKITFSLGWQLGSLAMRHGCLKHNEALRE